MENKGEKIGKETEYECVWLGGEGGEKNGGARQHPPLKSQAFIVSTYLMHGLSIVCFDVDCYMPSHKGIELQHNFETNQPPK